MFKINKQTFMKKISIILGIAFFTLSGCKKDYTCSCSEYTYAGYTTPAANYGLGKQTKVDAEEACTAIQTGNQLVDPSASCNL
jgi:hypothetical protein